MISLVVNKGVLVVVPMSVVNMFNSMQRRGVGGGGVLVPRQVVIGYPELPPTGLYPTITNGGKHLA